METQGKVNALARRLGFPTVFGEMETDATLTTGICRPFPQPEGLAENSPAIHCRVWNPPATRPKGTAETTREN
jgi:hypothetical protein